MTSAISIIIATRNRPEGLIKSINSLFAQSFRDFKIIVVDGLKDNKTRDVLRKLHDKRIMYLQDNQSWQEPA